MLNQENIRKYGDNWAYDMPIQPFKTPEITDIDVINQSIEMILTTYRGTRLFNLGFGSEFPRALFNNLSKPALEALLTQMVVDIKQWEDRIFIIENEIRLYADADTNAFKLYIPYIVKDRKIKGEFSKVISQ